MQPYIYGAPAIFQILEYVEQNSGMGGRRGHERNKTLSSRFIFPERNSAPSRADSIKIDIPI